MNYYGMKISFYIKKQAGKMTMLTKLPFHKDKDFQQLNFFKQTIVYIAGCVEYLEYQRQSEVSNLSYPV